MASLPSRVRYTYTEKYAGQHSRGESFGRGIRNIPQPHFSRILRYMYVLRSNQIQKPLVMQLLVLASRIAQANMSVCPEVPGHSVAAGNGGGPGYLD